MKPRTILTLFGTAVSIVTIVGYIWVDSEHRSRNVATDVRLSGGYTKHCMRDNPQKCFCTDSRRKIVTCPI